jgi:hypothetical protein
MLTRMISLTIALLLLGFGLSTPSFAQGPLPPVGSTVGSFDVSLNGGATYSIPIRVPPGTSGTEPKISLQYNSFSPSGAMGAGWAITGFSAITRGPKTLAIDGSVRGVELDDSDAL